MAQLSRSPSLAAAGGDRRVVNAVDLDDDTLRDGEEVTVWSKQVPEDKIYWWGHGHRGRDLAEAFIGLHVEASGAGTNRDGTAIHNAEVIVAVTDADQRRVHASQTIGDLQDLDDSDSENRADKMILDALAPFAKPGRYIEIRIRALDSTAGGSVIDSADSTGQLYYSEA